MDLYHFTKNLIQIQTLYQMRYIASGTKFMCIVINVKWYYTFTSPILLNAAPVKDGNMAILSKL
ncbi:hypothetical protein B4U84_27090 [Westiellopsis prolifica IICB1]|nr:hypothetical protein B4U84_27090 [Westiellopsis prolifica IICB1]